MPKRTKSKGRSTKKTESPQEAPSNSKPNQSSVQNIQRHIRLFFIVAILISFTFSGVIATRYRENICNGVENNHTPIWW